MKCKFSILLVVTLALCLTAVVSGQSTKTLTPAEVAETQERVLEFKEFVKSLEVSQQIALWIEHVNEQLRQGSWTGVERRAIKRFVADVVTTETYAMPQKERSAKIKEARAELAQYISGAEIARLFEVLCPHHVEKYRVSGKKFFESKQFMKVVYTSASFDILADKKLTCANNPNSILAPASLRGLPCLSPCFCASSAYCSVVYGDGWWCRPPPPTCPCDGMCNCGILWIDCCTGLCVPSS